MTFSGARPLFAGTRADWHLQSLLLRGGVVVRVHPEMLRAGLPDVLLDDKSIWQERYGPS